ncbi:MAG TPA: 3-oxoacyl-ACP reductase family protein [Cellvibrio sp.]|jgi:glucose 1-dehydrogenase|nr:3-oxoacyl-ACP reductase family protein [Cellvibrio sp.]
MRLTNKVALVTGSTQGIGLGIAERLAKEGADIIIAGRLEDERSAAAAEQVQAHGCRVCVLAGDISDVATCRYLITEGVARMGSIDILVNNAGVEKPAPFWEMTEAHFDRTMSVNLKGAFFTAQAFVQHLRDTGRGGKIINISSVHEELPFPNFTAYCASKGALKMMTRNLAIELAHLGITVNNIAPGAIETPMNKTLLNNPVLLEKLLCNIPLRRLGQPEDVAGLAAFLASADADYVTGSTFYVDGGLLWNYTEQ